MGLSLLLMLELHINLNTGQTLSVKLVRQRDPHYCEPTRAVSFFAPERSKKRYS